MSTAPSRWSQFQPAEPRSVVRDEAAPDASKMIVLPIRPGIEPRCVPPLAKHVESRRLRRLALPTAEEAAAWATSMLEWARWAPPPVDANADPSATELQQQIDEPTTLLAFATMLLILATGMGLEMTMPQPPPSNVAPLVAHSPHLPVERLPHDKVLKLAEHSHHAAWQGAVHELGRRGALTDLESLRQHDDVAVRAEVPLATLEWRQSAHHQIPWLAEGLESPDPEVRDNTATALRTLVREQGPFRGR